MDIDAFADENTSKNSEEKKKPKTGRRMKLRRCITVDTAAANNVMPKRMVKGKMRIRESEASRKGVHYVAASNGRIPNEGEVDFPFVTNEGQLEEWVFQIAEVNKALGSVAYLVDRNYRVTFDKDMKTGKDISFMKNKATGSTARFRRERNVWVLDAIMEEGRDPKQGFQRRA